MIIAIDFDGTLVHDEHDYDDLETPLVLKEGAAEAVYALKRAGHTLILWSGRSAAALARDPDMNPLVRAGLKAPHDAERQKVIDARHAQMRELVARELPGVFEIVDAGASYKPSADLFIDDRAVRLGDDLGGQSWFDVQMAYGADPGEPVPREALDRIKWRRRLEGWRAFCDPSDDGGWSEGGTGWHGAELIELGPTAAGPVIAVVGGARGGRDCVIVAGQHGEEVSGVIALEVFRAEIFKLALALGVRLIVVPLANPEGFNIGKRYNNAQERPTNAFLEYLVGGEWVGEIPPGATPTEFRAHPSASRETAYLRDFFEQVGLARGFAALDLHEDSILEAGAAFAYVFGDRAPYADVMRRSGAWPLAGHLLKNDSWTDLPMDAIDPLKTDQDGLVEFQDGSLSDHLWRRGASVSACLECSTKDGRSAVGIAREWILGFVRIAAAAGDVGARDLGEVA